MPAIKTKRYYWVLKATFFNAINTPDAMGVSWSNPFLVVRRPDVTTSNDPITGITKVVERYVKIPWEEVRVQFFSSIPLSMFDKMDVDVDSEPTKIKIYLNMEE